ncbi:MAG: HAMP domain-containing sensor histidine kinase [Rhodospirillaceae bacterium]|nr:HAMP domain-containing sensor histidine kinase [Rhodospirillaceae bacterium]
METLIGAIDVGILGFDAADHLVLANPWALKLHPALSDSIEAKESRQATGERLLGESSQSLEGAEFQVADRWIRSRERHAQDGGVIVVLTDITSEKHAAGLLIDARDSAMLADRAKSEFLANMTHELRTPLNAVIGFAEVLRDELYGPLGSAEYQDFVADIYDSGRHLLAVIDDILDLSKIEVGRRELRPHPMDITRTIDSAVRMLVHRAESGGVEVSCEYDEDLPFLNGEERGVKQILLNLLTNAVKFTPRGGAVTVSAVENQGLDIVVADNGVGIAEEDQQRVFTPFVQLDASGLQRYEGAGLGLALVKSLAEMHDATVALNSTEGEGTTITVHFPETALVPRSNTD